MRGYETAGINTGVIRKRRVAAGEGMVTPAREVTVTYQDGHKEELIPGRTRFDPSHTLVRQRPELFTLCAKRDRTSAPATFRAMLARAEREVRRALEGDTPERTAPRARSTRSSMSLGQRKPRRHRLR